MLALAGRLEAANVERIAESSRGRHRGIKGDGRPVVYVKHRIFRHTRLSYAEELRRASERQAA